jgi:predicted nucleotidyltransferase
MKADAFIQCVCDELVSHHGAHTVLLYGSHADGTATDDSDYDLAAFGSVVTVVGDARLRNGVYLDAFVYPESVLRSPSEEHLKLRGSRILFQRDIEATAFLAQIEELYRRGSELLPPDEIAARKGMGLQDA